MARLLMAALDCAGHSAELMATTRTYCAHPTGLSDAYRRATAVATRLSHMLQTRPHDERPGAWLTYHLYYKAPDWIGPTVARALDVPYLVVEASSAPKRLHDEWQAGEQAVAVALSSADAVVSLNPKDDTAVRAHLDRPDRIFRMLPFLDPNDLPTPSTNRADVAARFGLPADKPWILTVAMMRYGDKLASYRMLGEALGSMQDLTWHLIAAGDGPARGDVSDALGPQATMAGALGPDDLAELYSCADLLVWPAVNEAFGMALLEARAAGLPVIAGDQGAVATVVEHGRSGLVVSPLSAAGMSDAMRILLTDPARRQRMAHYARSTTPAKHGIAAAAAMLDKAIRFAGSHRRIRQTPP